MKPETWADSPIHDMIRDKGLGNCESVAKRPSDTAACPTSSLTPETDAMVAADQHHLEDDNFFPATVYWRICDLARTLERERDEWRKKAVDLNSRYNSTLEDYDEIRAKMQAMREALEYIVHSGLSARHLSDYARTILGSENA